MAAMLGDDVAAILPELRQQAESRMRTPCLVRRPGGTTADLESGADVTVYAAVWAGLCRIGQSSVTVAASESASSTVVSEQLQLHVPVGAGPFAVGDEALVSGRAFRIDGLHVKDEATAQRLPVTEIPASSDAVEGFGTVEVGSGPPVGVGGLYYDAVSGNLYMYSEG